MTAGSLALALQAVPLRRLPALWVAALAIGLGTAAFSSVLPEFRLLLLSGWVIYGILALSLALVWGQAGIFSFGQPAFFGAGGYMYGIVAINYANTTGETITALAAAILAGAVFAALLGYFMFYGRVGDVYIGIITLAVTLVLLTVVGATSGFGYRVGEAFIGGYNGMRPMPRLMLPWGAERGLDIQGTYWFVILAATGLYLLLVWLMKRPMGRIFAAVRENELRAELLGYDVRWHKLQAFTLGGALAGLAGGLFAAWAGIITPSVFALSLMALVVIWVLVGGRVSLFGAFVGALLVQALSNYFGGAGGLLSGQTPLALGIVFVLFVLLLPGGLIPTSLSLAREGHWRLRQVFRPPEAVPAPAGAGPAMAYGASNDPGRNGVTRLETRELAKAFGGLQAVDGVSLHFDGPRLYSLIGPNGAGKSTFFNLLTGRYPPTRGQIVVNGQDISHWPAHKRARTIIGVKLQQPSVFRGLTVQENVWLAAYARYRNPRRAEEEATQLLERVALSARARDLAGDLSHGEQQWLEIAMVLALEPPIILLDEPTAGMTRGETLQIVPVVQQLAQRHTVIVVEHDMTFVDRLGAPVIVLHQGKVLAEGQMNELRRNESVLDIYLGRGSHAGGS